MTANAHLGAQAHVDAIRALVDLMHALAPLADRPPCRHKLAILELHGAVRLGAIGKPHWVVMPRAAHTLPTVHVLNVPDRQWSTCMVANSIKAMYTPSVRPRMSETNLPRTSTCLRAPGRVSSPAALQGRTRRPPFIIGRA
eukprot:CAMPEP_0119414158 /NCGR_PEP_ID=MMETSP1335-20130426/6564_1 /TAXON_ID=259385 /ORGANISM="Chrysoculter rhomboideus, Strain RCC1486" /LENGTH=140 /DNA_ID=CAMNT_0007439015 /DNA_START=298 /DNA_END=717 /DNA_ORIENTATION=+